MLPPPGRLTLPVRRDPCEADSKLPMKLFFFLSRFDQGKGARPAIASRAPGDNYAALRTLYIGITVAFWTIFIWPHLPSSGRAPVT